MITKKKFDIMNNTLPTDYYYSKTKKEFIFDIVNNKRNSIDVDKYDYIKRDSYHLGIKDTYYDYDTLIQ